jgi:hypothetical protein
MASKLDRSSRALRSGRSGLAAQMKTENETAMEA